MSELITFVTVDNCLEAIEFYKTVFGAEVVGDITMLEQVPGMEKHIGKVGHSTLKFGNSRIFLNDITTDYPLAKGDRIQLVLDLETETQLRTAFNELKKEGKVISELQEVFWGALFGTVKDKFDVTWQLYYGHK